MAKISPARAWPARPGIEAGLSSYCALDFGLLPIMVGNEASPYLIEVRTPWSGQITGERLGVQMTPTSP
jgi:hypothetical protein